MNRIVIHWTAGGHQPNSVNYKDYHYMVNKDGLIFEGKYKPEDNLNCNDGKYAQHTGGGNTGSIGISMCGMAGFKNRYNVGNYPLTKKQVESCFEYVAKLCKKYRIKVTPYTVFTHYEFGKRNPNTTSKGKIDIIYLPPYPNVPANQVGDFIRQKVKWYMSKV